LAPPHADTDMMQLHVHEIARNVAAGATGKLDVLDNITPTFLPSRAPELNPVENIWQYLRQNWLSNTGFPGRNGAFQFRTERRAGFSMTASHGVNKGIFGTKSQIFGRERQPPIFLLR
jgi:hypothetical protein